MREVVRICGTHRLELEERPDEQLWCPCRRGGHPATECGPNGGTPRPSWEIWVRVDGRLVVRLYILRRGKVWMEEWYEEFSRNYAADLNGRDPDGLTPEARFAGRYAASVARTRAEGRRARLAASVGLSA